jgi:signal transduction histidine kinase
VEPAISINYALGLESGYKNAIQQLFDANPEIIKVTLSDTDMKPFYEVEQKHDRCTNEPNKALKIEMHDALLGTSSGYISVHYIHSKFLHTLVDNYNSFLIQMLFLFIVSIIVLTMMIRFSIQPLKELTKTLSSYVPGVKLDITPMEGKNEVAVINNATIEMLKKVEIELQKRMKSEKELSHKSRLESMGEMIDNIAHQWRQPLMNMNAIFLNLDRTYELGKLDDAYLEKTIQEATDLTSHMSQTIEDFRNFFRKDNIKERVNLNDTLTYSLNLLSSVTKDIIVCFERAEEITLPLYKNELIQVIISILTNAVDILEQRQILNKQIFLSVAEYPEYITIIIEDNGGGIADEHIDRIFEPYYSTKHQFGGSGLGIYICNMIIEEHMNGTISVDNTPIGAQFTITLKKEKS